MFEKVVKLQILILGLIIGLALIFATRIVSKSLPNEGISVTGSAYEIVQSDSGRFEFDITTRRPNRKLAYETVQNQIPKVISYLKQKGFTDNDIEIKMSNGYVTYKTLPNGNTTNEPAYYNLYQPISVKSNNVQMIKDVSTDINKLISQGIDINTREPEYYYSKLSDLKVKLLKDATKDAKQRASAMLNATHNRTGCIQSVKMGVFQITPVDSNNVSDMGINDTTTIEKKVTAVANVVFRIK